ncbi:MAG: CDP-glucose 4,6-dehydratase [Gammaproteobacteria bacterium]|jgi:CDP-glucose 4,6-dehydratase|nr:CDP-glucose 4,6-dehydratase [Gammaproteobacteria bacterium]
MGGSSVQMPHTDAMADFWRDRRVLLTGHTGFKGAWMSLWLKALGAEVTGYALPPATEPNLWSIVAASSNAGRVPHSVIADIRDAQRVAEAAARADPQIVIHMAAQALVRESYRDPLGTYATNVMGTAALLQACRSLRRLECVIVVTSDKVYENRGEGRAFDERDALGGHDPYSNSKACAELVTASFRDSFFADGPPIATVRAGNVIGGGDWAQDRLVPDCVRALESGRPVNLRYPHAVRPWQHVLEPLSGYLTLAQALVASPKATPRAVNFGPDPASFCTVREVVDAFSARFGGVPGWVSDPSPQPPEARALTLSSELAGQALGWHPRLDIRESLSWTADWYSAHTAGENMAAFSEAQVARYRELMRQSP